jgi:hypothetical protein
MSQLALTPLMQMCPPSLSEHPDDLVTDGTHYRKISKPPPRNRNAQQSSWIWQHGQPYAWLDDDTPIIRALRCHHCQAVVKLHRQQASNFGQHLVGTHEAIAKSSIRVPGGSVSTSSSVSTESRPQGTKQLYFAPDVAKFRQQLVRWCVEDHIAFHKVDTDAFRSMMVSVNPLIKPFLCSRQSLCRWIEKDFTLGKEAVKLKLRQALSKKHISFDIWTSPGFKYGFLGVVAHCVVEAEEGPQAQSIQLALRRIKNRHSGENMALILLDVLCEFEISLPNLGVFMADNEEANDKAIRLVLNALKPGIKQKEILARRARCVAHIINLAAQAFLFGNDVAAFENSVESGSETFDSIKLRAAQEAWRRRGAMGKLHNIIQHIFSSPQRQDAWRDIVVGIKGVDSEFHSIPYQDQSCDYVKISSSLLIGRKSNSLAV